MTRFRGQALQDEFVFWATAGKRNGFFVEIGSNHPIEMNNDWEGVMIEYDEQFLPLYRQY